MLFDIVFANNASQASSQAAAGEASTAAGIFSLIFPFILFFVVFYLFIIMPQRKRDKKFRDMLNSLIVGDEIVTNAGIIGKIISIKDDTLTIEVGADRVRLKIYKWAVKEVLKKAEPK